jgi:hypothetical protein
LHCKDILVTTRNVTFATEDIALARRLRVLNAFLRDWIVPTAVREAEDAARRREALATADQTRIANALATMEPQTSRQSEAAAAMAARLGKRMLPAGARTASILTTEKDERRRVRREQKREQRRDGQGNEDRGHRERDRDRAGDRDRDRDRRSIRRSGANNKHEATADDDSGSRRSGDSGRAERKAGRKESYPNQLRGGKGSQNRTNNAGTPSEEPFPSLPSKSKGASATLGEGNRSWTQQPGGFASSSAFAAVAPSTDRNPFADDEEEEEDNMSDVSDDDFDDDDNMEYEDDDLDVSDLLRVPDLMDALTSHSSPPPASAAVSQAFYPQHQQQQPLGSPLGLGLGPSGHGLQFNPVGAYHHHVSSSMDVVDSTAAGAGVGMGRSRSTSSPLQAPPGFAPPAASPAVPPAPPGFPDPTGSQTSQISSLTGISGLSHSLHATGLPLSPFASGGSILGAVTGPGATHFGGGQNASASANPDAIVGGSKMFVDEGDKDDVDDDDEIVVFKPAFSRVVNDESGSMVIDSNPSGPWTAGGGHSSSSSNQNRSPGYDFSNFGGANSWQTSFLR